MARTTTRLSRREFLVGASEGLAGLAIGAGLGCGSEERRPSPARSRAAVAPASAPATPVVAPVAPTPALRGFPTVEARGSPGEIGAAVGAATAGLIRESIARQQEWFDRLRRYALADRAARLDPYVAAAERAFPDVVEEMRGIARGSGVALDDILVLNLQAELSAMIQECGCAGCSDLHLVAGGRALLAHNEDGDAAYRDLMVVLRLRPEGRPAVVALAYPGVVPGNVPGTNDAGIVLTTNYIAARQVRQAVPRYVLGRAVLGARTLGEALSTLTTSDRAYAFTANLGSTVERRLLVVETTAGPFDVREAPGLFVHTNHLLLPGTRSVEQVGDVAGGSSGSRLEVLTRLARDLPTDDRVDEAALVRMLSSHEAATPPFSPCRHPVPGGSRGRTLATAVFDLARGSFVLYEGNPCEGRRRVLG